ncbi:MAG TPA: twitch domain-containing radical SAM protein [Chitinophagales bacterium]|nr:twitch domain-containing radical SAM protein [Chitinophagales bacterium]
MMDADANSVSNRPLCYAPFTSLLIDTNKGVRPCCSWHGEYFGNLHTDKLSDIINSKSWKGLQNKMLQHEWHPACHNCKERELYTGTSVRLGFQENAAKYEVLDNPALIEVELNSSNICNLACIHCSSDFSSSWIPYEKKLAEDQFASSRTKFLPQQFIQDPPKTIQDFKEVDSAAIKLLRFKGGEPFMNKEAKQLLLFLDEQGRLPDIEVEIITNGSVIDKDYLPLLQRCKSVKTHISIDGINEIQKYIRFGNSSTDRIESFISFFSQLNNIQMEPLVSVMPYNVFRLHPIIEWWTAIHALYPSRTIAKMSFNLLVMQPEYLNVNVLSDETRAALVKKLELINDADMKHVIQALQAPYAGAYWHTRFVQYTRLMNEYRRMKIEEIVPELAPELV